MAINLIACSYYAPMFLKVEELVETNPLQEIQEKELTDKINFVIPAFKFSTLIFEIENQVHFWENSASFSSYEQDILLPPPDFSSFSS
jgi:hypothetical protein